LVTVSIQAAESRVRETALEMAYAADAAIGSARDAASAAVWYRRAAEAGDSLANLRLGYLSETGDGVPQDYAEARRRYQAAVDGGLKEAGLRLAICYLEGWGGSVDRSAFVRELRSAAEGDYVPAQRVLATIYFLGLAVSQDRAEGIKWLERAAKAGDVVAQVGLGQSLEVVRRLALSPDLSLARNWYQLSAEAEYRAGMVAMAQSFLTGKASDRNWALGLRWLELAVEAGDSEAPYVLAVYEILHPDAVKRDEVRAREWLDLASERGNDRATEVVQLAIGGKSLADALRYVINVPIEERYVQIAGKSSSNEPTRGPVVYRVVKPIYPQSLRFADQSGEVLVDFTVNTTGRVVNAKVLSAPHPLFGARALEAVRQWRFEPGRVDGRLADYHMQVPVVFQLEQRELDGADGILQHALDRAEAIGPRVLADATDLRIAEPLTPATVLELRGNEPAPSDVAVMLLLVLDKEGQPLRGHILEAHPKEIGQRILESALEKRYKPRMIGGEPVPSNGILVVLSGSFKPVLEREK
jgi:hypothetical protein